MSNLPKTWEQCVIDLTCASRLGLSDFIREKLIEHLKAKEKSS